MDATKEQIAIANSTSRAAGAVGARALVPRVIREIATPSERLLDFGAGHKAIHALSLRSEGYQVTAHEFGVNIDPKLHDPSALDHQYDLVYASNVLNVQSSDRMLRATITQIRGAVTPSGSAVVNYPISPRKLDLKPSELQEALGGYFSRVERVAGTSSAPVWRCWA